MYELDAVLACVRFWRIFCKSKPVGRQRFGVGGKKLMNQLNHYLCFERDQASPQQGKLVLAESAMQSATL